jgi:hypothetical protein
VARGRRGVVPLEEHRMVRGIVRGGCGVQIGTDSARRCRCSFLKCDMRGLRGHARRRCRRGRGKGMLLNSVRLCCRTRCGRPSIVGVCVCVLRTCCAVTSKFLLMGGMSCYVPILVQRMTGILLVDAPRKLTHILCDRR